MATVHKIQSLSPFCKSSCISAAPERILFPIPLLSSLLSKVANILPPLLHNGSHHRSYHGNEFNSQMPTAIINDRRDLCDIPSFLPPPAVHGTRKEPSCRHSCRKWRTFFLHCCITDRIMDHMTVTSSTVKSQNQWQTKSV